MNEVSVNFFVFWELRATTLSAMDLGCFYFRPSFFIFSLATFLCGSCHTRNDFETAWKNDASATNDGQKQVSRSSLPQKMREKTLVKIGNRNLLLGEFADLLENMDEFEKLRYQSTERRKQLLQEIIDMELLAQRAEETSHDQDELTQAEIRHELREAYLAKIRQSAPKITDLPAEEVKAYYEAHLSDYRDPERRRVSALHFKGTLAEAKQLCVLAKQTTTAKAFGELVRDRSEDQDAKKDLPLDLLGDLGIVGPPSDLRGSNPRVPEVVRAAVFEMSVPGEVYEKPIPDKNGMFWIVRFAQKLEARERSYEEAERTIRLKLLDELLKKRLEKKQEELVKKFDVKIDFQALDHLGSTISHIKKP